MKILKSFPNLPEANELIAKNWNSMHFFHGKFSILFRISQNYFLMVQY